MNLSPLARPCPALPRRPELSNALKREAAIAALDSASMMLKTARGLCGSACARNVAALAQMAIGDITDAVTELEGIE